MTTLTTNGFLAQRSRLLVATRQVRAKGRPTSVTLAPILSKSLFNDYQIDDTIEEENDENPRLNTEFKINMMQETDILEPPLFIVLLMGSELIPNCLLFWFYQAFFVTPLLLTAFLCKRVSSPRMLF